MTLFHFSIPNSKYPDLNQTHFEFRERRIMQKNDPTPNGFVAGFSGAEEFILVS